jgi:hypothetical protein
MVCFSRGTTDRAHGTKVNAWGGYAFPREKLVVGRGESPALQRQPTFDDPMSQMCRRVEDITSEMVRLALARVGSFKLSEMGGVET